METSLAKIISEQWHYPQTHSQIGPNDAAHHRSASRYSYPIIIFNNWSLNHLKFGECVGSSQVDNT